jgi:hypothetical protein
MTVAAFSIPYDAGIALFTQPLADGVMRVNGEICFERGRLSGPQPFVVGHRTLKAAAQRWYMDRSVLVAAYTRDLASPWPFMQKEAYDAPSEPAAAESDGGSSERQVVARHPEKGREGVHEF